MISAAIATPVSHRSVRRRLPQRGVRQMRLAEVAAAGSQAAAERAFPSVLPFPTAPSAGEPDPLALVAATIGKLPGLEALTVPGGGQPDALLAAGDTVLLQRDAPVADGELCVVRKSGSAEPLIRRVHVEGSQLRLQPENRAFAPEWVSADQLVVDGRVVAIIRQRAA